MKYKLEGLDCPSCAAKIESKLHRIKGLSNIKLNFSTKTIDIEPDVEKEVAEIIKKVEPGVKLIAESSSYKDVNEGDRKKLKAKLFNIILSTALLLLGVITSPGFHGTYEVLEYSLFFAAYLLSGWEVVSKAIKSVVRGQMFNENFLMTVATIGAFAIHHLPEAVGVMLLYSVGEYLESLAVNRSRSLISKLMDIRPDYANLVTNDGIKRVKPETVRVGEVIVVKPGEKLPLDGIVIEGSSYVDTSAITGESLQKRTGPGDKVMAGMVNKQGLLKIRVEKPFAESSVSKILNLVQDAAARKAATEKFITKFARYYTPAAVFAAAAIALIPPLVLPDESFKVWIYRALTVLVISCPCALVISIPLGYFGGIGACSRRGILVKGANFLEALTNLDTVVFDKTGTLTEGVFKVVDVKAKGPYTEQKLLHYAAHAEVYSSHPIAKSILEAYKGKVDESVVSEYREIPGQGVTAKIDGKKVMIGNEKLIYKNNITFKKKSVMGTVVHVSVDNNYMGYIVISDKLRSDARFAIENLKKLGIRRAVMLTGDARQSAQLIAKQLGIQYHAELLPEDKVHKLEEIQKRASGKNVAFAGDGINDAPVITRADVGIAMGGMGSDAAIEAADVVIMEDMPSKIAEAVRIAKYTKNIVIQNIVFTLGVKLLFLSLGATGLASMWHAVFADVGVALIAVINSIRTLFLKK